jgi:class 3 adenylate cyclase/pimeloyl-ACP methyl ester carboxylesterase
VRDVGVRWASRAGKSIAYAVFGTGPLDVFLQQAWCPIDLMWELPQLRAFLDALSSRARVIVFDNLGNGASDSLPDPEAATIETFADVTLAVLDAAGAPRVILLDTTGGGSGATFAATYPARVQSLIVVNLRASFPEIRRMTTVQRRRMAERLHGVRSLELQNPRLAHDPELRAWWAAARRLHNSPEHALEQVEFGARADYASVLPTVRVPTLVLHRRDNRMFDVETSRTAASRIPGARFVELPGSDSDLFLGDIGPVFAAIDQFLSEPEVEAPHDRPLATVLFTDMVASTEKLAARGDDAWRHLLDDHDKITDRVVAEHRGHVIKQTGDGILATFDGPARAVRCAVALVEAANRQGITLRAGLHTGEIELRPADVTGIAVHIASRIATLAGPNEILVSRTVVDLTAGSGLEFELRGEHQLKGVPGTWPLLATRRNS